MLGKPSSRAPRPLLGLLVVLHASCAASPSTLATTSTPRIDAPTPAGEAFLWLEDIEGPDALAWVRAENALGTSALEAHPDFEVFREDALAVLTSPERLPYPRLMGGYVVNFWRDAQNERGVWRRVSPEGYRAPDPAWDLLLDVDALAAAEDANWMWAGASCAYPAYRRCLVSLSIGGADASVRREFDVEERRFISPDEGGYLLGESKSRLSWRDENSAFYGPAFTEEQMTSSGYPRAVYLWERGRPPEEATLLLEGEVSDVSVWGTRVWDGDTPYDFIGRSPTFYTRSYALWHDGQLLPVEIPEDARIVALLDGQLVVELKSPWQADGATFPQGALVSADISGIWGEGLRFALLFEPEAHQAIEGVTTTQTTILVSLLSNVVGELLRIRRHGGTWEQERVDVPSLGTISVISADDRSDRFYYTSEGFLTPPTLYEADAVSVTATAIRREPSWFDEGGMRVDQRWATSADGTEIPYFVVSPPSDSSPTPGPVLLSAYGGFEISRTPFYSGVLGRNWLARGGTYVVANLRGGGEFGPRWHQAALREQRQRSFEDLIAVAEHLITEGVTTPAQLAIQGGSNGGLLVAAVMVQRPELFGAVVSAVPLLDMRRYHLLLAGASWIAEYGDPDLPEDWAFLRTYCPFYNLRPDAAYPVPFVWTSTRDDRVHPGHARRFVARMRALGHDVVYYENIEGGHGGAANQRQRAYIAALTYAYLWSTIGHPLGP